VCKEKYLRRHFFYQFLCPSCGDLNYHKRYQSVDLSDRIALVTGGRIKIGFQVALRLLRAGAQVIVTSRFPHDAAQRYAKVHDFQDWKERLHVVGLDLRYTPSVEDFINYVDATYPYLDILINNAAQTVRRPPAYYAHLIPFEQQSIADLPLVVVQMLAPRLPSSKNNSALDRLLPTASRQMQIPLTDGDTEHDEMLFPQDQYDRDGQQIDNRQFNSWVMRLDEVPMPEMLEVHLVNAVAPALLAGSLRNLMTRSPHSKRYLVNVSSVEGLFSVGKKRGVHPHTNMAKAALNMLTRSIAEDYAQSNIFVNSVDPGWVSDQFPRTNDEARAAATTQLPIDIEDAAARVCDPIFSSENAGIPHNGNFLKDYQVCDW
jgi:NAD(P)-dependent dehydrogenase (short-subunit alcohol dehydrogenase family)